MLRSLQEGMQELKNEITQLRTDFLAAKDAEGVQKTNDTPKRVSIS